MKHRTPDHIIKNRQRMLKRFKALQVTQSRRNLVLSALIIGICAIAIAVTVFALHTRTTSQATVLSTAGWEMFHDPNGVSVAFPGKDSAELLTGVAAGYNAPSGQSASDAGNAYQIKFPNPSTTELAQYSLDHAETTTPTDNMILSITLFDDAGTQASAVGGNLGNQTIAQNRVPKKPTTYTHLQTISTQKNQIYKVGIKDNKAYLLTCTTNGDCSPIIHRQSPVYPYAIVKIYAAEGDRYGGGTLDLSSHNYAVMLTVLSTLNLDAVIKNSSIAANQSACYAFTSQPFYEGISYADVIAIDPTNRTLTLQYYPPSTKPAGLNDPLPQQITQTFTVPSSARIAGGGDCISETLDAIHQGDQINLYKASATSTSISTVYDTNG